MGKGSSEKKETFFTKDPAFYSALFKMLIAVALQNLIAYSVNMADNIMLGRYSQEALSGAAAVNQIFFVVQQITIGIGNALVILASQYWGEKRTDPIRSLTGIAVKFGLGCAAVFFFVCLLAPEPLMRLFTNDEGILREAVSYLALIQWTFLFFMVSSILMAALRSVGTVKISFYVSVMSLIINVALNYLLIFGHCGFPRLGVSGAAVSTLVGRIAELLVVVGYLYFSDKKIRLFKKGFLKKNPPLRNAYLKTATPILIFQILWSVTVPIQTGILGHLSSDAIAANSVATTFYQYLKVIVVAMSSVSSVLIGNAIGRGDIARVRSDARSLAVIDVCIGFVLGGLTFVLRTPLLSYYKLSESATRLAINLIGVMSLVMIGMSYQMPVSSGIIQGGGDTKFTMIMNLVSVWVIVMPLSFLAAFYWKLPVEWIVLIIQSDQIFKGIPSFLRFRSYKWIKKLTG